MHVGLGSQSVAWVLGYLVSVTRSWRGVWEVALSRRIETGQGISAESGRSPCCWGGGLEFGNARRETARQESVGQMRAGR